eukprot:CAMPEP_0181475908 /NCGR_PEP_ID=MMETSP1110-20121109/41433_1 /TAXON_ID=174948 /ORGANISM="Symbiodinium sp., Strain CCMP421" /LENGTH=232 /DNA_ID=CAMNT_0023601173 /DNA_START=82 /DNA_END=780 /DNA_ORIENTATION=-
MARGKPGSKPGKRKAVPAKKEKERPKEATDDPVALSDRHVAEALAESLPCDLTPQQIFCLMSHWQKPILKARIPGQRGRRPTKQMLETAKKQVKRFLAREKALGDESKVVKAFQLASGEPSLRFDWQFAEEKARNASLDRCQKVDQWSECFAMTSGHSNLTSEIFLCGTKKLTQKALNSLLCHESLHNLARRNMRPGNPFFAEDTEHMAMALLGDPQLVHEENLDKVLKGRD